MRKPTGMVTMITVAVRSEWDASGVKVRSLCGRVGQVSRVAAHAPQRTMTVSLVWSLSASRSPRNKGQAYAAKHCEARPTVEVTLRSARRPAGRLRAVVLLPVCRPIAQR